MEKIVEFVRLVPQERRQKRTCTVEEIVEAPELQIQEQIVEVGIPHERLSDWNAEQVSRSSASASSNSLLSRLSTFPNCTSKILEVVKVVPQGGGSEQMMGQNVDFPVLSQCGRDREGNANRCSGAEDPLRGSWTLLSSAERFREVVDVLVYSCDTS